MYIHRKLPIREIKLDRVLGELDIDQKQVRFIVLYKTSTDTVDMYSIRMEHKHYCHSFIYNHHCIRTMNCPQFSLLMCVHKV